MRANITQYVNNKFEPTKKLKGLFFLSANQASGVTANNPIQYDTEDFNNGIKIFEAIVETQIHDTTKKQIDNLKKNIQITMSGAPSLSTST